jgi:hypothetical protein
MVSIFISHSSKDAWLIDPIARNMRSIGIEPYLAELDTPTPYPLPQKLDKAIDSATAIIVVLSSNVCNIQQTRDVVNWEISSAYAKKKQIYVFAETGVDIPLMVSHITVYARYDPLSPESLNDIANKIHELSYKIKESDDTGKAIASLFLIVLGIFVAGSLAGSK